MRALPPPALGQLRAASAALLRLLLEGSAAAEPARLRALLSARQLQQHLVAAHDESQRQVSRF